MTTRTVSLTLLLVAIVLPSSAQWSLDASVTDGLLRPELQYAHAVMTPADRPHPVLVAGYVQYFRATDSAGCKDCTWYRHNNLVSGIRVLKRVSGAPLRVSLGVGLGSQFDFANVVGSNDFVEPSDHISHWFAVEGRIGMAVRLRGPLLLVGSLVSSSGLRHFAPRGPDVRVGLGYSR